jgi:translation initiation factor 2B subunit (eIF-2B alpha/beta/delta family)
MNRTHFSLAAAVGAVAAVILSSGTSALAQVSSQASPSEDVEQVTGEARRTPEAPLSTFDPKIPDGSHIPIEERPAAEVTGYGATRWAPQGVSARNPAFDVTPAELITGIITEKGVVLAPDREKLQALMSTGA